VLFFFVNFNFLKPILNSQPKKACVLGWKKITKKNRNCSRNLWKNTAPWMSIHIQGLLECKVPIFFSPSFPGHESKTIGILRKILVWKANELHVADAPTPRRANWLGPVLLVPPAGILQPEN
jgi:hypothetical protein